MKSHNDLRSPEIDYVQETILSDHQHQALQAIHDAVGNGELRGFLNMATGLGKTLVAAKFVGDVALNDAGAKTLYVAHQNSILDQARGTFEQVLPSSATHGNLFGGEIDDSKQNLYSSFRGMNSEFEGGRLFQIFDPREFKTMIVDEGHHSPAPTHRQVIEYFEPDFLLGLTATPDRRDEKKIEKVLGRELHRVLLEDAIADGSLATPDYRVLTDHVKSFDQIKFRLDDMTMQDVENELFIVRPDEEIVEIINQHLIEKENPRTIVFAPNVASADHFANILGGDAKSLHSKLDKDDQNARLQDFRKGKINTIVAVDQLNEGVDVPEANVLVFLRSTESKTIFLQQLGRGLRRIPGKDEVLVLDFVANWDRIRTVRSLERDIAKSAVRRSNRSNRGIYLLPNIRFDFSSEVEDAIDVIQKAREVKDLQKKIPQPKQRPSRKETSAQSEQSVKDMLQIDKLTNQTINNREHSEYDQRIASGDMEASAEYLERNYRYIWTVAKNFADKNPDIDLDVSDLFQSGCDEFMKVCKNHGTDRYDSLKTTVYMHMMTAMKKALPSGQTISYGYGRVYQDMASLRRIQSECYELGLGYDEFIEYAKNAGLHDLTIEYAEYFMRESLLPLDKVDIATDETDLYDVAIPTLKNEALRDLLEDLSFRERRVLELHYGLGGESPKTLEEIGKTFNVMRERIRQIENQAIKKIRWQANIGPENILSYRAIEDDLSGEKNEKQRYDYFHVMAVADKRFKDIFTYQGVNRKSVEMCGIAYDDIYRKVGLSQNADVVLTALNQALRLNVRKEFVRIAKTWGTPVEDFTTTGEMLKYVINPAESIRQFKIKKARELLENGTTQTKINPSKDKVDKRINDDQGKSTHPDIPKQKTSAKPPSTPLSGQTNSVDELQDTGSQVVDLEGTPEIQAIRSEYRERKAHWEKEGHPEVMMNWLQREFQERISSIDPKAQL